MDPNEFPTKGNLILAKNTLRMSRQGYDLLDKKRNVLIKEIMALDDRAKEIQTYIDSAFREAYEALQVVNIDMGVNDVERFSYAVAREESVSIKYRSIMGVEIPVLNYDKSSNETPSYGLGNTTSALDDAYAKFNAVKDWIIKLSMVENAAYRLAVAIRKTQKRANALKNVTIPRYENLAKTIQETLDERERDEFTRLKVIKKGKERG
ncbi:MAG: V-type ATP synthase subunit D [Clostridiales bacterium]|jgi:V/A-type H+-transporting ATPase subunit D|nr:V-type ATP synthase subunit D [Clostridiales bacterium]